MHKDFADWYRQINVEPTDDQLKRRWSGVEAWIRAGLTSTPSSAETAHIFVTGAASDQGVMESFVECFRNDDTAFDKRNTVEIQVLAGAAIASQLESRPRASRQSVIAGLAAEVAVFCRKKGQTPPAILDSIRRSLGNLAVERRAISASAIAMSTSSKLAKGANDLETATYPSHVELGKDVAAHLKRIAESQSNFEATLRSVQGITHKLAEEINVLWWFEGRASRGLRVPWRKFDDKRSIVLIAAKELADLTSFAPGFDAAPALLERLLQENAIDKISIWDAVTSTPHEWLASAVTEPSSIFTRLAPVVTAVLQCAQSSKGADWKKVYSELAGISAKAEIDASELASQAYREFVLLNHVANE